MVSKSVTTTLETRSAEIHFSAPRFFPILKKKCEEVSPSSAHLTLCCRGESFNCQLHTTHVGAVGWKPHGSSPTTCTGKADHVFGVCVPLALICLLKIVS